MLRRRGFTLIELMIVVAIISIVAAMATPSLIESRKRANEAAAIGALHAIITAEARTREIQVAPANANVDARGQPTFAFVADNLKFLPSVGYPRALTTDGLITGFAPDPVSNWFVTKQGYRFYGRQSTTYSQWGYIYTAFAWPILNEVTGDKRFVVNQSGLIQWRPDFPTGGVGGFSSSSVDQASGTIYPPYAPVGQ